MNSTVQTLRIAVADSDADTRRSLQELLSSLGHEVVAAESGPQLVAQVRATRPDLVIAEAAMPEVAGIAAVHEGDREGNVPVILVSARRDGEPLDRRPADHVMAYLVKPIHPAELVIAVHLAVVRFGQLQEMRRETAELRQALEDRKLIERAKGVLMKHARLDEGDAFQRLQQLSRTHNRKLAETARIILTADEALRPPE